MIRRPLLVLLAAAHFAAPAMAQTAEERAKLDAAAERGLLLYHLDRAAWVATDDFLARMPNAAQEDIRGYVTELSSDGFTVTFYAGEKDSLVAAYVGRVSDGKVVSGELLPRGSRPALTAAQIRLAKAREIPRQVDFQPCAGPFNVTAIPPQSPDAPLEVYLLSPQVTTGEYPIGGHFLVALSPEGAALTSRKFTNTCLAIADPEGAVAFGVTHLLDPVPTEMHVFTSLAARKPIFVGTSDPARTWEVSGTTIRLVDPR